MHLSKKKRCFTFSGGFIDKVEDNYVKGNIKRYYGNKRIVINKIKKYYINQVKLILVLYLNKD